MDTPATVRRRTVSLSSWFLFALTGLAVLASPALVAPELAGQELCPERYHVEVEGEVLSLPFCSTQAIDEPDPDIRRIVFSIHGVATNAGTYFDNMVRAAERVPGALDETLIIGPKLMTASFADDNEIGATDVFWRTSSQRFWGGPSGSTEIHPRGVSVSSFEIFDRLLTDLTDPELFPNLEIVVLAGHSGGGQFTNRYAVASRFEEEVARPRGVHVRYVVAQPSSHVYLTPERVDPEVRTRDEFSVPSTETIDECEGYNRYGSGLEGLDDWPYIAAVPADQMQRQFGARDVIYFHGLNDSDPEGAALARGCAAMMQGAHRLERGITYFNYVNHLYGEEGHDHRISFVARVGHSHAQMWASDQGLLHIFDYAVTVEEGPLAR